MERAYDIVLVGATGFSGRLAARYLARHARSVRWAIAGRDRGRLEGVRRELGGIPEASVPPIVVADTGDRQQVDAVASAARVVCTTVGPYRRYGTHLVRACAAAGTHYCDITGEIPFVRASIDDNHARAQETGARIVHACGFDSIPSDLGTFLLAERARALGEELGRVDAYVSLKGRGAPGGVESALALVGDARSDRALWDLALDPHALDPDSPRHDDDRDRLGVGYDPDAGRWTAPFVMAMVNTRVVRRSAALLGYGSAFRYSERSGTGRGPLGLARAVGLTAALGVGFALASFRPAHGVLRRLVHAEGPRDGWFRVDLVARTTRGTRLAARVAGQGDAGCEPTAMMLAESALSLAADPLERTGVLTPASALGTHLVDRVRRGGLTMELV